MDKISEPPQGKNHHLKMYLREGQTMDLESGNIHDSSGVMNDAADAIEELEKERDEMLRVLSAISNNGKINGIKGFQEWCVNSIEPLINKDKPVAMPAKKYKAKTQ